MDALLQDLRDAARSLKRSPGFTGLAVLTLALGIGATVAVFGVLDGVVLRPLPFPEPDRLVHVSEVTPEGMDFSSSEPNYLDMRASRAFEEMAAYRTESLSLTGAGDPERLQGAAATHTLFPLLGAAPALGRTFSAEEDRPGGDGHVVVIGHELWTRRFRADPGVVGERIMLDGEPYTVTGVMPPGFRTPDADFWIPLAPDPHSDRDDHWLDVLGRMRPGVDAAEATAELESVMSRIGEAHPEVKGWSARTTPLTEWLVSPRFRQTVAVLFGAVGFLLLMACANLANLLLARGTVREREAGVRAALGASRARLVRRLLLESLLLSLVGAAIGFLGAAWALEGLRALAGAQIPRVEEIGIDGRVAAFALALSVLTSLVFGLLPAARASRVDLDQLLRQTGRTGGSRAQRRIRDALVVSQVALAMVLLVGAGLMIRSFARLAAVHPGFDETGVLAVPLQLPTVGYAEPWQKAVFYREILSRIEALPGVISTGATAVTPFSGWNFVNGVTPEERVVETAATGYMQAGWRAVTPGFFHAMRIPVRAGRAFQNSDRWDGPKIALVSATLAERLWPGEDPVGKRLHWGGTDGPPRTVVGVVGDVRDVEVEAEPAPMLYIPHNQLPMPGMTLVVRTTGGAEEVAAAVRREIWAVDPGLPIPTVELLRERRSDATAVSRLHTLVLAAFAAVALALAAVGIYGILAFGVAQRHREIGIRMALGARSSHVSGQVVRRGLLLTATGIALGLAGAVGLTRVVEALLYETAPTDPLTFVGVPLAFAAVALLASYVPARRATRVDPAIALRAE